MAVLAIVGLVATGSAAARPAHGGKHKGKHQSKHGGGGAANGPIGGTGKGPSAHLSRHGIASSGAWRSYVLDSPGPFVTAIASIFTQLKLALFSASSNTGIIVTTCCREASSGTTPPYF